MNNEIIKMTNWLKNKNNFLNKEDKQLALSLKEISFKNNNKYSDVENIEDILLEKGRSNLDKIHILLNGVGLEKSILEGYLLFLGQNYELKLASIVACLIYKKYGKSSFLDQYLQFIRLNTENDGSVGIVNPIRNDINSNEILEWKFQNTYFTLIFLKLYII